MPKSAIAGEATPESSQRTPRMDVLEAAWKHVGKGGKASGIDGVKAEDLLDKENGVKEFLAQIQEELRTKSYQPSPVKGVSIWKADGKKRPLGIPQVTAASTRSDPGKDRSAHVLST